MFLMSKRSRRKKKGKRHRELMEARKKTALIKFLEATRIFGIFLNPGKKRSKAKLVLIQIIIILSSALFMYFSIIVLMEPEIMVMGIVVMVVGAITIIRAILTLYAHLIKGYEGL